MIGQNFLWVFSQSKFSLAPSAQVSLGQKISSAPLAPLTTQGPLAGGGGSPPQPPPPPLSKTLEPPSGPTPPPLRPLLPCLGLLINCSAALVGCLVRRRVSPPPLLCLLCKERWCQCASTCAPPPPPPGYVDKYSKGSLNSGFFFLLRCWCFWVVRELSQEMFQLLLPCLRCVRVNASPTAVHSQPQ